jgi:hypothetical protein
MPKFLSTAPRPFLYAVVILALMLFTSYQLRSAEFDRIDGAPNIIATYHTLLTVTALDESPAAEHFFLPTVSLGRDIDKHIPWGATRPTSSGDFIYTSFYSPGYVAPYLWFKAWNLAITEHNLVVFNFVLGCLSTLILFLLLNTLLRYNGFSPALAAIAAVAGCIISVFSREALLSNGVTYWCHSLWQPLFLGSLLCFLQYQTSPSERGRKFSAAVLLALAFVGPLTEWTGYIFNAGLITLLWVNGPKSSNSRALALKILLATALAMALMLAHLILALGLRATIGALLARFVARNASSGSLTELIGGYGQSYGLFLIGIVVILAIASFSRFHDASATRRNVTLSLLIASAVPLAENLLLLQHASMFSFDRLKFIAPSALLIALAFASYKVTARIVLAGVLAAAALQNFRAYRSDIKLFSAWSDISSSDKRLAGDVLKEIDPACTVFASSFEVRGYANLLFHHGIHENATPEQAMTFLRSDHGCALVYLEGASVFDDDLPAYTKATITRTNGESKTLLAATTQTTTPNTPLATTP